MQKSNFHTHTLFSDGHNSPEEMVCEAIDLGFKAIGFSDHSYTPSQNECSMLPGTEFDQFDEVKRLKYKYIDLIDVYAGIELDMNSRIPELQYDYLIGSVHEIVKNGESREIDNGALLQQKIIDEWFGGSVETFAREYFELCIENAKTRCPDIVGHFDLLTKYSLFDESDPKYRNIAIEAVREVLKYCKTFEMNTGAIARGYRKTPYPDSYLVDEIKNAGGRLIITYDCHYREKLTTGFDTAEKILLEKGFRLNVNGNLNAKVKNIEIWE